MAAIREFVLKVNGKARKVQADPDMPLLWALRQELGVSGVKFGCGAGLCGACTIHLDGLPARACQTTVGDAGSSAITTIEGLNDGLAARLREAWLAIDVVQCGYCQAGQIMTAHALLKQNAKPDAEAIDAAMEGNICRCSTYPRIRQAIRIASGQETVDAA